MKARSTVTTVTYSLAVALFLAAASSLHADYVVSKHGDWPDGWPQALESLRKDAQSFEGPLVPLLHHGISFTEREVFEAAWPFILSLKSEGAPIVLKRGPSFWLGERSQAGVCIHTPPTGQAPVNGKGAADHWQKSIYIELIVDGDIIDLNRIFIPGDTPIVDQRFANPDAKPRSNDSSAEKDGAVEPTTSPGPKSEGNERRKPETERRSR